MNDSPVYEKYTRLKAILAELGRVAVAFSGGTDSTLVLRVAHEVLGEDNVIALTAVSPSLPTAERQEAEALARHIGVRHVLLPGEELANPNYLANTPNRCFFCKEATYGKFTAYAREHGYRAVVDGSNADDALDYRPGRRAAQQYGVRSPLQEAGLTKAEARLLARELGLPNWDKPSAACLASRIPYGTPITAEILRQIEQAEAILRHILGARPLRVRHHGTLARIEVEPTEFARILAQREEITRQFTALGYPYVTLDLRGFRSGSMNEVLPAVSSSQAD